MARRRTFIDINPVLSESATTPELKEDAFDECSESFYRHLRANQRSEHTIKYYRNNLVVLENYLRNNGHSTRLRRLSTDILAEGYLRYAKEVKHLRPASIQANLRAFRAFFNWAVNEGIIEESPMKNISVSSNRNNAVITFNAEQVRELLSQPDLKTFVGLRDYTIMLLMLDTGVRLREITDITVSDIRFADSQILIHGKNGRDRLVPFQAKAKQALKTYLKVRGKVNNDWLFLTHDDGKMARGSIQKRIYKYGRMAMMDDVRCSPHTFRHTFAKMSVRNGANIFELQKILGHETLDMVRVYVNLFSTEVTEAHKRFSPLENLYRS